MSKNLPYSVRNYNRCRRCVVTNCENHKRASQVRVYKFPDDMATAKVWCDLLGVPISVLDKVQTRVCGLHFTYEERHTLYCRFTSKTQSEDCRKCQIADGALPSLNLPQVHNNSSSSVNSNSNQHVSPEFVNMKQEYLEVPEFVIKTENMLEEGMPTQDDVNTSTYDDINMGPDFTPAQDDVNMIPNLTPTCNDINIEPNFMSTQDDINMKPNFTPMFDGFDMTTTQDAINVKTLCRICAQAGENMEAIYGSAKLYTKINLCLPIKVRKSDSLSLRVCHYCVSRLELSYELATQSQRSDVFLRSLLQQQNVGQQLNEKNMQRKAKKRKMMSPVHIPSTSAELSCDSIKNSMHFTSVSHTPLSHTSIPASSNVYPSLVGFNVGDLNSSGSAPFGLLSQDTASNSTCNVQLGSVDQNTGFNSSKNKILEHVSQNSSLNSVNNMVLGSVNQNTAPKELTTYISQVPPLVACSKTVSNPNILRQILESSEQKASKICKLQIESDTQALNASDSSDFEPPSPEISLEIGLQSEIKIENEDLQESGVENEDLQESGMENEVLQESENFLCEFCLQKFVTKKSRQLHLKLGHTFMCTLCKFTVKDVDMTVINHHYRMAHCHENLEASKKIKQRKQQHKPKVKELALEISCDKCLEKFKSEFQYETHNCVECVKCPNCEKITSAKKPHKCFPAVYYCKFCPVTSSAKKYLKKHMEECHNLYLCPNLSCYEHFEDKKECMSHYNKHNNLKSNNKSPCEYCGVVLSKTGMKQHVLAKHNNNHTFDCDFCDKKYKYKPKIVEHMYMHIGDKQFQCKFCPKKYYNNSLLGAHVRDRHTNGLFACECGKICRTKKALNVHIQSVHDNKLAYHCSLCDQGFADLDSVLQHFTIHKSNQENKYYITSPFQCDVCLHYLKNKSNLKLHMKRHEQGKNGANKKVDRHFISGDTKCQICSKVCASDQGLELHMYTHENKSKFHCDICDRKFPSFIQMRAHRKFHFYVKNKVYSCDKCETKFTNKKKLLTHFRMCYV